MRLIVLLLCLMLAWPCAAADETIDDETAAKVMEKESAPPRSIADIERLLGSHRPNSDVIAKKQALADEALPQTNDRQALYEFYLKRARAAAKVGRVDQEIADLHQATTFAEKGSVASARAWRALARAQSEGGYLVDAAHSANIAVAEVPTNNNNVWMQALRDAVYYQAIRGNFKGARRKLIEAEEQFARVQKTKNWEKLQHEWLSAIEHARAEVARTEGRLPDAEQSLRKSLSEHALAKVDRKERSETGQLNQLVAEEWLHTREVLQGRLSAVLLAQGKLVEAEIYARRELMNALNRVGQDSVGAAMGLSALGRVLSEQGRSAEANRIAEFAVRSYQLAGAVDDSPFVSSARKLLASSLVDQRQYAEGLAVFEKNRGAIKNNPRLGAGHPDWVLALLRTGNTADAEQMAMKLANGARKRFGEQDARAAMPIAIHAMTLAATGKIDQAARLFAQVMPVLTDSSQVTGDSDTSSWKRERYLHLVVQSYLELLAGPLRSSKNSNIDIVAESFRLADIVRGSNVQRALTASAARANIPNPKLADLARREQDLQRRIAALSESLVKAQDDQLADQPTPVEQSDTRQNLVRLNQERTQIRQQIANEFPDYAELVSPKPATVAQMAKLLKPGEALIAFYFGEQAGYVWAMTNAGKAVFVTVPLTRAELAKSVTALRKSLDPSADTIDDIPAFDVVVAHRLYTQLLQPVESVWRDAKVLVVVPHAELGQLPLALLPTAAITQPGKDAVLFTSYKTVPWLARKAAIAQLPSVTALASLRKLPPPDNSRRSFIGFGDPLFSQAQAKEASVELAAGLLATRGKVRLRSAPHTAKMDSAGLALLPRLPDTNEEIREIAKVLGADPTKDIYLQDRATETTVLNTDLSKRRVVMFSTHGLIPGDLDGLIQPALALTSPDVVSGGGDGFLTMDRVMTLKLNADWVVLSACNTASGDGAGAEAVSGLGRSFFYAGARALLVSNWPVETVAARKLMTEMFHQQMTKPGQAKSESLRQAMLDLADGPGAVDPKTGKTDYYYAHPIFWAPFVVVGD